MEYAFIFPGQGSQSVGMMKGFADIPAVRETFAIASDVLSQDLWQMVEEGPEALLNQTVNTQPVMLAAGIAVYRAWERSTDSRPSLLAGHSLGEYSALVASGAISFEDGLALVRFRAECMQEAVPEGTGGIAAILGLEDEAVRELCSLAAEGEVLEAVNYNSPGQVVIAGNREAVLRGMDLAKARGAKRALMLPMSVPSHCSLMKGAAEKLAGKLAQVVVSSPSIPVINNADVAINDSPEKIRDALARQLYQPVRWVETVRAFSARGVTHVAECAPGKVLAGLNKRIDAGQTVLAFTDAAALEAARALLV